MVHTKTPFTNALLQAHYRIGKISSTKFGLLELFFASPTRLYPTRLHPHPFSINFDPPTTNFNLFLGAQTPTPIQDPAPCQLYSIPIVFSLLRTGILVIDSVVTGIVALSAPKSCVPTFPRPRHLVSAACCGHTSACASSSDLCAYGSS